MNKNLKKKIQKIKFFVLDVDAVMTDGGIYLGNNNTEFKKFNVRDGSGVALAGYAGLKFAVISGRYSEAITSRMKELKIRLVYQDVMEKGKVYEELKQKLGASDEEICFIGDDVIDIPIAEKCGFSACPSDAVAEIKKLSDYICRAKGGEGCVREVVELVLKGKGLWGKALAKYLRRA